MLAANTGGGGAAPFPYARPAPPPSSQPTPNSPVNPYVASQMPTGTFVPGFSSDGTDPNPGGFLAGIAGAQQAPAPPVSPTYGVPNLPPGGGPSRGAPSSSNPGLGASAPASTALNPFDGDPGYAAANAAEALGIPTINGDLQNQIARRLTQWGDASFANQAGFGMDPQAAAFARQNYLTGNADLARLDHSHQLARQAIINRLAGHGLLFSGDTGYQTGQEDQNYGNQVYDGQQRVLGDLYGFQSGALGQKQALRAATVAAMENAFMNASNHPGLYGDGTISAPATATAAAPVTPMSAKQSRQSIINQLRWQR